MKLQSSGNALWFDGWYGHDAEFIAREVSVHAKNADPGKNKGKALSIVTVQHLDDSSSFVASLRQCAKLKNLPRGSMLYNKIQELGLLPKCLDAVVHMFVKCGALEKAHELLSMHQIRNVSSWTTLIDGYARQGQGEKALNCFDEMQGNSISPDAVTYACILKACGAIKAAERGKEIHDEIVRQGLLETNVVLANSLIDMYARCGMLRSAHSVLEEIPCRDIVSWNVMIAGYARQGEGRQALDCFEQMQGEGFFPNAKTFASVLKACGTLKAFEKGDQIHDEILKQGLLTNDIVLGNALVDMYVKCGALPKAQKVVDELSFHDTITWNTLIAGYVQQDQGEQALSCFKQMQLEGFSPDTMTFTCVLKACGSLKEIDKGEKIYDEISRQRFLNNNIVLCNALIDMYAKCGSLIKARQVLVSMPFRDIVSWNSLIGGYSQQSEWSHALDCFKQMKQEGFSPDAVTFTCLLKACGSIKAIDEGEQIHEELARQGLLKSNVVLATALIDMYAKCDALEKAQQVLEKISVRDVVAWNVIILGYAKQGRAEQTIACFEQMYCEGLSPNAVTLSSVLKAYGMLGCFDKVEQFHDEIGRRGWLGNDLALSTALVDAYVKCGALTKAQHTLEELPFRNTVSWSALIAGYAQQGHGEQALQCFARMKQEGFSPDAVTYACILKACGTIKAADVGEQIHSEIARHGWLESNSMLGNAVVDMYANCGALLKAGEMLKQLRFPSVVSWNTLIAGYVQHGETEQALKCFGQMQLEGISPNEVTFGCTLKACAAIGATDKGAQIHDVIMRQDMLGSDSLLGTALVDMYAKGGALVKAQQVLEELPCRDVVSWSALVAGYAQWGQDKEVRNCLDRMQREGFPPNLVTFSSVLNACSRSGLVEDGYMYLMDMVTKYGVQPHVEHYSCLVDLLGRAGHLDRAIKVIQIMPYFHHFGAWSALLCACQKWGDVNVGRWAFEQAVRVDKSNAAAYVLMANIYSAAGMQEDASKVNAMRMEVDHRVSHSTLCLLS
ncbi:hypothetical protein GOP47_0002216 [Adiantum capillus-veneris]|uniref:Pentatricopeptide repeat-containing protein n=1 Tax=Adiantum capillus-veneris TaxID=13818 RepID=A0A9D4VBB6_ADICA|nr:hypothetical protein GOP47_0002216 [Adiantum capillus-veneris]